MKNLGEAQALDQFSAPTREWFSGVFGAPTPAQVAAWQAINSGHHALVIAPTGSGKTLAAFAHAIDRLATTPSVDESVKVLYISPLKALAVDVERNLQAPLRGIRQAAERLAEADPDVRIPEISVGVRSGDTTPAQRRAIATHPPDILITTPESLFLMLSSQAAATLTGVQTIIVDEIHALAGTKRGAHLMLSLERLSAAASTDPQRIGLSATVEPPEAVARFLGGDRPVVVVAPKSAKTWDLRVMMPLEDMTDLRIEVTEDQPTQQSIWPHLEPHILDLIENNRSTICFVNSRRSAERLTTHLNELAAERAGDDVPPVIVARAHHGSVSKSRRQEIEGDLKAGRLKCVVATSSLELGIDMGAVDLVIQVQAPPSIANGLQRVGRAGHQVGATSTGVFVPTARGDLVESVVVAEQMVRGKIEPVHVIHHPLDVLAQQIVSAALDAPVHVDDFYRLARRSDPYRGLPRAAYDGVLDMLAGRYPSEDFAELRPRLVWDRVSGLISARPGSRRLVTTSGGTIPDRGTYGVFIVGSEDGANTGGRRVGELDEEMVYESRVGDVFTLGTTSWRIDEITPNQVLVTPAPGVPGKMPFWHGDNPSRPVALGVALGQFVGDWPRSLESLGSDVSLDDFARMNIDAYVAEQREATGVVPDDHTIVVERFRDELGDWRLCIHSQLGTAVLSAWAMVIEDYGQQHYGVELRAHATNDGIIVTVPDIDAAPPGINLLESPLDDVERIITDRVFGSALFAARFRECAARALLLPRRDPGRRTPLWQQRMRSSKLLEVATTFPDFPIVLEAMRECLEDVLDVPAVVKLLGDIAARRIKLVEVETANPSPFARTMLFGYLGAFIYDDDQPLAERRLAALSIDPSLLAELLGRSDEDPLFDPALVAQVEAELQRMATGRKATTSEALWDLLRSLGPLTADDISERCDGAAASWLQDLRDQRRVFEFLIGGKSYCAVSDDAGLLRDGLGIPILAGIAAPATVGEAEAQQRLIVRWLRYHGPTSPETIARRYLLPQANVIAHLEQLETQGDIISGRFGEGSELQFLHQDVLRLLKRRSIAELRSQVQAVDARQFARFLAHWHGLSAGTSAQSSSDQSSTSGPGAVAAVVDQLAGSPIPASMLESVVLPARIPGYRPEWLDSLLTSGEVVWTGAGALGRSDGWVQLWPADVIPIRAQNAEAPQLTPLATALLERLRSGGAWRAGDLASEDASVGDVSDALWELAWSGLATSDSLLPVRQLGRNGALKTPRRAQPRLRASRRPRIQPERIPTGARWSAVPCTTAPSTEQLLLAAELIVDRSGVVTKGAIGTEVIVDSYAQIYRILAALEESGALRRGYFVEGLGASQFAAPGAVDRLREASEAPTILLAACDPANPYGASLPWPEVIDAATGHRPSRTAGALVVLSDGELLGYLERGAHTALLFTEDPARQQIFWEELGRAVDDRRMTQVQINAINGAPALTAQHWHRALESAGFAMVPQGFRRRPKIS